MRYFHKFQNAPRFYHKWRHLRRDQIMMCASWYHNVLCARKWHHFGVKMRCISGFFQRLKPLCHACLPTNLKFILIPQYSTFAYPEMHLVLTPKWHSFRTCHVRLRICQDEMHFGKFIALVAPWWESDIIARLPLHVCSICAYARIQSYGHYATVRSQIKKSRKIYLLKSLIIPAYLVLIKV